MSSGSRTSIDPVKSAPVEQARTEAGWVSVVRAFNPLGPVVEMYAKTLTYRIESKRLALEARRVEEQARLMTDVINRNFELEMEKLRHRRITLERTFGIAEQELAQQHILRMEILQAVKTAQKEMANDKFSLEEKMLFKELAVVMIQQIPVFGQAAQQNLNSLIQALPKIDTPRALLEG